MAAMTIQQRQSRNTELDRVKNVYFIPASNALRKLVKMGILPKECIVLWANENTIKILENAKKT